MNKICTNIKESKRLIELGIDLNTADMYYMYRPWEIDEDTIGSQTDACIGFDISFYNGADNGKTYHYIPAWSLAALLDVYPMIVGRDMDMYYCWQNSKNLHSRHYDNPVDACYEMILKLNELKML